MQSLSPAADKFVTLIELQELHLYGIRSERALKDRISSERMSVAKANVRAPLLGSPPAAPMMSG